VEDGPDGADGGSWEALPGRALEVLARACSARAGLGSRATRDVPTVESVERLVAGVGTLAEALGRPDVRPGDAADVAVHLRAAADLLGGLGEAARRVACSAGAIGQEPAADTADTVMCVALILRLLAELGLRTVPPAGADGCPSR
jgi:hypothetical protein